MVDIQEIDDPFDRYIAFLVERDKIYQKKSAGEPWPWTQDDILQSFRFTEVYRERDRTSLHYQKSIRNFYGQEPIVLPATVLYRWFNRIETCNLIFNQPDFNNKSIYETYILDPNYRIEGMLEYLHRWPPPYVTGAYTITGHPGFPKEEGVLRYFDTWCKKPWKEQFEVWQDSPPTLQDMFLWLREDCRGLGSFMAAQLVADLKYLPFMTGVLDWWSWAAPGPGSMRGLNVVCNRAMNSSWREDEWLERIQLLNQEENRELKPYGLGPFHCQDTQNHCCEYSKYTKVIRCEGRPRQRYHHG
jgi:hypothetical protein